MKARRSKLWVEIKLKEPKLAEKISRNSIISSSKSFLFEYDGKTYKSKEL